MIEHGDVVMQDFKADRWVGGFFFTYVFAGGGLDGKWERDG